MRLVIHNINYTNKRYPPILVSFLILYIFSDDTISNILIPSPSNSPIIKIRYLLYIFNFNNRNRQNIIFRYLKYFLSFTFLVKK